MNPHEKSIKQTAKKISALERVFQMGQFKIWLEDNG